MYRHLAGGRIRWALAFSLMLMMLIVSVSCAETPPPIAAFTAEVTAGDLITDDPITGLAPLTVSFSDRSTGEIKSWRWNFGDGSATVYERNPSHTYTKAEKFTVRLSVEGPGGSDSEAKTWFVNILSISEAANQELNQAKKAIEDCLDKAGVDQLDAAVAGWDGSAGKVTAGNGVGDASDYITRKPFKATYDVALDGTIYNGDPGSWGSGIVWYKSSDPELRPDMWRAVSDI